MPTPEEPPPEPMSDPDALARALEIELMNKRIAWQRAKARRGAWLALSILFLLLVVLGGCLAYFYFLPELTRRGENAPAGTTQSDR